VINKDIPPFLIYKGKLIFQDFVKLIYHSRIILACNNNSWSNDKIDFKWLKYFNKYIRSVEAYRLLILNRHDNHAIFAFTNYARKNKIVLIYLPPHTIHRLQLLDIAIFASLTIYYSELGHEHVKYIELDISKRE
jgi:hypothetical protein